MGRIKKPTKLKTTRISTLAVLDDIIRANKALSASHVKYEDKIVGLLQEIERRQKRISQYRDDNSKLRREKLQHEDTIDNLKNSLDKAFRELEEEGRQRSLAERRLVAAEQQLDFIRQILNDRGGTEDALEQARNALMTKRFDGQRFRTSSGRPVRPSANFSLSAGSLLDPEDVSHDRSLADDRSISRLRERRSVSEPPVNRERNTNNKSGRSFRSPILSGGGLPFSHTETLTGPSILTSQTRITVTDDKQTVVDTEVRVEPNQRQLVDNLIHADTHGILSSEESETGRNVAKMAATAASTPSTNAQLDMCGGSSRKRASDDSQDSYFGIRIPEKKMITEQGIQEQTNTNRPATPDNDVTPIGSPLTGNRLGKSGSASRLTRRHNFITKPILKFESCFACNKRIMFGKTVLKCSECKSMVHHDCKEKAPQPCIPASHGRTPVSKSGSIRLAELCPAHEIPQIPGVIIHCVNEVESRGLMQEGIYRVSGTDKQVKDLLDRFIRGRPPYPSLSSVEDIHAVCGCIKLFIRRLSEPLITYKLWTAFADLAESVELSNSSSDAVSRTRVLLQQLPRPNRDTLAFLILHLQRVANSGKCHMGIDNLAKVLGPTLVGFSCPEPEPLQAINQTRSQQSMMRCFLRMPNELFRSMLQTENHESPLIQGKIFDTPLIRDSTPARSGSSAVNTPHRRVQGKTVRKPVFDPLFEPL